MKSSKNSPWIAILIPLTILAILVICSLPYFDGYVRTAKMARADHDVVQIASAVTAFHTEYGRLPSTNGNMQDVGGSVIQALMGLDPTINPRNIVFLEVQPASWSKPLRGGLYKGAFVDPWGSPYKMKLDTDGDLLITEAGAPAEAKVRRMVAVWGVPPSRDINERADGPKRRSVKSWD
jgi:hypothetical protein